MACVLRSVAVHCIWMHVAMRFMTFPHIPTCPFTFRDCLSVFNHVQPWMTALHGFARTVIHSGVCYGRQ